MYLVNDNLIISEEALLQFNKTLLKRGGQGNVILDTEVLTLSLDKKPTIRHIMTMSDFVAPVIQTIYPLFNGTYIWITLRAYEYFTEQHLMYIHHDGKSFVLSSRRKTI